MEGETTWTKTGRTHIKTDYEDDDDDSDEDDDKPKAKKTRGRPKKSDSERSQASMPWGGKPPKDNWKPHPKGRTHTISDEPPKGTPERGEWEAKQARKNKNTKHKIKEGVSMLQALTESVNFKKMMEEQHMTVDEMLDSLGNDIKVFKETGECSDLLRDCMMIHSHGKKQITDEANRDALANPEIPTITRHGIAKQRGINDYKLDLPPTPGPVSNVTNKDILDDPNVPTITRHKIAKERGIDNYKLDPTKAFAPTPNRFDTGLEEELNELAKLAGIADEGNAFTGKLATTAQGDKFDLGGQEYTDTSDYDKKTTLEDIAKLSGIAVEGRDYGDAGYEEAPEYDNTPDPEVEDQDVMLHGGDGEVAGQEKKMSKDGAARFSDNVMDKEEVEESYDPLDALSGKLRSAYESIKIQK
jgi:hypothetical protein